MRRSATVLFLTLLTVPALGQIDTAKFQLLDANHATLTDAYALLDSLFKAGGDYQDSYDEETFYGRSSNTQRRWKKRVDTELKQLDGFSFEKVCTD